MEENRYLFPIHFAIPLEKFVADIQQLGKDNFFAPCNPTDKTTYIYKTETEYYQQYQESFFGITMKKAGWDCLRHYEIIAQGCAPYFYEIREIPYLTMHRFPRYEVLKLMQIADEYLSSDTSKQAKGKLDELIDQVILDVEPTIVCNDEGKQAVIISLFSYPELRLK